MPSSTKARSTALARRFFSLKNSAPQMKLTTTEPRLTIETMLIMDEGSDRE